MNRRYAVAERLGVGIIGCGQATQVLHLPTLASLPEFFRVSWLVDAAPTVAETLADRVGAKAGTNAEEMLADADVDVVLVATPDAYHARYAVEACRAGKRAVLVETPLALTPGEARAVARASDETGVPVLVGTTHRYDPAFQAALLHLQGTPDLVLIETLLGPNESSRNDAVQLVRGRPLVDDGQVPLAYLAAVCQYAGMDAPSELFGTTVAALTLSIHDLALLRATLGEPERVEHLTDIPGGGYELVLDYGGPKAIVVMYQHETGYADRRFRWLSRETQVTVRFPQPWGLSEASSLSVCGPDEETLREERFGAPGETALREEWRHLHAVATEGVAPLTSAGDAAADIALVERVISTAAVRPPKRGDATRVAFLGAGWATAMHGAVLKGLPDARVTAVASRTAASAERRSWWFESDCTTFGELDELLARGDVDVAIVTGPPSVHAAHAKAALAVDKHVIVEKPLCTTLAEADEMVETVRRGPGKLAYAENYAFAPQIRTAAEIVASGRLGALRSLHVYTLHGRPRYGDFLRPEWGGGTLFDMGAHTIYWALRLAGSAPVTSVKASLESAADNEGDDYADVELSFQHGLTGRVEVSWREASMRSGASVEGSEGTLEMGLAPSSYLRLRAGGSTEDLPGAELPRRTVAGFAGKFGYVQQLQSFLEAFRSGAAPQPGVEEGRAVLEIIAAAYASAGRGGDAVELPFAGNRKATPYELWRGPADAT